MPQKNIKRDEVEEDNKIEEDEEDDIVKKVRAKIEKLKLEIKSKKIEVQDESRIRLRRRLFCCSCRKSTGVKTHKYPSCRHRRCPECYRGE